MENNIYPLIYKRLADLLYLFTVVSIGSSRGALSLVMTSYLTFLGKELT